MELSAKAEQFGKYTILGRIASGGMASVYLGRERLAEGPDRWVAIKRVHPHLIARKDVVQMFLNEAKLLARLEHENISSIVEFGTEDEAPYIVMQYLHGVPLSGFIRRMIDKKQSLPVDLMAYVSACVADGLHHAHEAVGDDGKPLGLVHRDVSPQNIYLTFDGQVALLDFGVAKAAGYAGFTRIGHIKGKYAYMSPEQVAASPLDRRSDVFSLGIVLWESLTGRHLFRRKHHIQTLRAIARADVPLVCEYNCDVPKLLCEIVAQALVPDRTKRYQTARELGEALRGYLGQKPEPISPEALGRAMREAYPDTRHPSELGGLEDTQRLAFAAKQQEELRALYKHPDKDEEIEPENEPTVAMLDEPSFTPSQTMAVPHPTPNFLERESTAPLSPKDTAGRGSQEFEDGTEVQPTRTPPNGARKNDVTVRDSKLEASERQAITHATMKTVLDSQVRSRGSFPALMPNLETPAAGSLAGLQDSTLPPAGGTPILFRRPKRSMFKSKRTLAELAIICIAALALGGLIYGLALRFLAPKTQAQPAILPVEEAEQEILDAAKELAASGRAALLVGDYRTAEEKLNRCLELAKIPDCHRLLGALYADIDDSSRSIEHYRKYVEMRPDSAEAAGIRRIVAEYERSGVTARAKRER